VWGGLRVVTNSGTGWRRWWGGPVCCHQQRHRMERGGVLTGMVGISVDGGEGGVWGGGCVVVTNSGTGWRGVVGGACVVCHQQRHWMEGGGECSPGWWESC